MTDTKSTDRDALIRAFGEDAGLFMADSGLTLDEIAERLEAYKKRFADENGQIRIPGVPTDQPIVVQESDEARIRRQLDTHYRAEAAAQAAFENVTTPPGQPRPKRPEAIVTEVSLPDGTPGRIIPLLSVNVYAMDGTHLREFSELASLNYEIGYRSFSEVMADAFAKIAKNLGGLSSTFTQQYRVVRGDTTEIVTIGFVARVIHSESK